MSLVFSFRSDTINAYYAPGGEVSSSYDQGQTTLTQIIDCSFTGCIGAKTLNMDNSAVNCWRQFFGADNTPAQTDEFTIVYRMARALGGSTSTSNDFLFQGGGDTGSYFGLFTMGFRAGDELVSSMRSEAGSNGGANQTIGTYNFGDTSFKDFVVRGTHTGNLVIDVMIDAASIGGTTFSRGWSLANYPKGQWNTFTFGRSFNGNISTHYTNEVLIFDHYLTDASITSVFTGSSRTAFYSATAEQPINTVGPGAANVVDGTAYTIKGISLTGTFAVADYTDPGVANVLSGTGYVFNDATLTGTLSVPTPSTGTAATVPLGELKEQIRYVLNANNTATGAPIGDLSDGLTRRVQMILKVNPEKIPPNDNILPALTVFIDSKSTAPESIARNGATGKRKAEISLKIAGMVWEPYTDNRIEDPADEDLEKLMENAEKILRGYDSLSGNVSWQFPTQITYHSLGWDEKAHYRGSIMDIKAILFY